MTLYNNTAIAISDRAEIAIKEFERCTGFELIAIDTRETACFVIPDHNDVTLYMDVPTYPLQPVEIKVFHNLSGVALLTFKRHIYAFAIVKDLVSLYLEGATLLR